MTRPATARTDEHSLPVLLALHLAPGIVTAALFYLLGPLMVRAGYPPIAAGIVAGIVGVTALELGFLLRQAHRATGRRDISAVLPLRPGPFTWRRTLLCLGLVVWGLAASIVMASVRDGIKESAFAWMPGWALAPVPPDVGETSGAPARFLTAVGFFLVLVLVAPLVEELYFRGYLLPRLARLGAWAPLVNVALFALYHLWKPWDFFSLVVILAPMVYAVWRTRDVRVGIAVHIGLNGTSFLLATGPQLLLG
ncbi:CPBP family intramembrane metalloprotease [Georgenia sp. EYE_87]|uniref:CPBP family intramembrane glutamic endopeptidase n=1 Tax=Georgenia sp. EYE_87 TaxID=2853448 RepID=UPI002002A615|nr:CPBP family intramembrane glutamic endopeptidase [Georgenia sp. EYE_87]MCK6209026.1 CPBP family intramembrane metalloprotease [Georgenia sp. EYE_87]